MGMRPGIILLLLFIAVPLIEITLFIQVGYRIGTLATISVIILTAILGAVLVRQQGFSTLQRLRTTMDRGELPAMEMLEAGCLLFAGALLMTPGFFTDAIGFLCLVPPLRQTLIRRLLRSLFRPPAGPGPGPGGGGAGRRTIEGEYTREDD
ncbi:MAG: FxsA family protein [Granulosicoccaceae bacterium]|jgi:UPF0716 protein FxsA